MSIRDFFRNFTDPLNAFMNSVLIVHTILNDDIVKLYGCQMWIVFIVDMMNYTCGYFAIGHLCDFIDPLKSTLDQLVKVHCK